MPIHGYPGNIITANPTAPTVSAASGVWTTEQQLQAVSQGNWPGYEYPISRSLRFNSADTPYLNRTPASAGNRKTWTWSGWIKRSSTTQTYEGIFQAGTSTSAQGLAIGDSTTANIIAFYYTNNDLALRSTQVLRDVSAWYHIVVALDTTQATASNRLRIYLNGSEITTWTTDNRATAFSQNSDQSINNNIQHIIGNYSGSISSSYSPNGYMTEINFIDGQALTPSSFGLNDPETGIWSPKQYTGTYGTNGFFLSFSDNSNTTSTTLGKDSSGNGNNWTPNGFSVTAGAGNDSLVDTPTSYGTDTGVGGEVRGNYATWNPLENGSATFVQGNLRVTTSTTSGKRSVGSTILVSSGSWYTEVECVTNGSSSAAIGIANTSFVIGSEIGANCYAYYNDGMKIINGSYSSYGASYTNGDIIGIAFDATNGTITFYKNGSSQGQITSIPAGTYRIAVAGNSSITASTFEANFGQRAFAYTAPSGFKALCTQNLPTPTIGATSTTQAGQYFGINLWTGDGATSRSLTGVGFQPDFSWIKARGSAYDHALFDAVRGVSTTSTGTQLSSNLTAAQPSNTNGHIKSFDSDGFSIRDGTSAGEPLAGVNRNLTTYVAWNWKANGAGSTNTAGTITSTVSANTTAGFSIVTYTGNGTSGATVGHGLGVAPSMIIIKNRTDSASAFWCVYHSSAYVSGADPNVLYLNSTQAQTDDTNVWGSSPSFTSTTFKLGDYNGSNGSGDSLVAYCFAAVAGYSAFGSYTGNGSTDGPFVYTGFRPRYVMIKLSSAAGGNWIIVDTARDTYNLTIYKLGANVSDAENGANVGNSTQNTLDILSNGFKLRATQTDTNGSNTYIYAAFAESPFKYALAR